MRKREPRSTRISLSLKDRAIGNFLRSEWQQFFAILARNRNHQLNRVEIDADWRVVVIPEVNVDGYHSPFVRGGLAEDILAVSAGGDVRVGGNGHVLVRVARAQRQRI